MAALAQDEDGSIAMAFIHSFIQLNQLGTPVSQAGSGSGDSDHESEMVWQELTDRESLPEAKNQVKASEGGSFFPKLRRVIVFMINLLMLLNSQSHKIKLVGQKECRLLVILVAADHTILRSKFKMRL